MKEPSDEQRKSKTSQWPVHLRLLGILPLGFFVAHSVYYWTALYYSEHRGIDNMLWMCNFGNLVMAVGLLCGWRWMIRMAFLWAIPGLPLWLFEVVRNGGWLATSFLTHIGALLVGIVGLRAARAGRWAWLHAFAWYLTMQLASRFLTSPERNVNVAHRIYGGYEKVVSFYWEFWLLSTLMVAAGLWVIGLILMKVWPPLVEPSAARDPHSA